MTARKSDDKDGSKAAAKEKPKDHVIGKPLTVVYIGYADIKNYLGHTWSKDNNFTIPAEGLSEGALENLRSQPDFRVTYE